MDDITRIVQEMYRRYPYPSREAGIRKLTELHNLLQLFAHEAAFDFRGKRMLDAGTGTGHRLVEAARHMAETSFVAVDMSEASLAVARGLAADGALRNVEFQPRNLLGDLSGLGRFDAITCLGVLHHLSNPAAGLANLVARLEDHGILFLYLYGAPGGRERMRRKQIVTTLMERRDDFEGGLRLIKELQFESLEYGWNLTGVDGPVKDGLLVDAYLNVNEALYDSQAIAALMRGSGLAGYTLFGISSAKAGYLFDTALGGGATGVPITEAGKFLPTPHTRACYERLPLPKKIELVEAFYQPNGYTLVAFKGEAHRRLPAGCRLLRNFLPLG